MAQPSQTFEIIKGFFHSQSKTNTLDTQYIFESPYKSAHTVLGGDIWADVIGYASNSAAADAFAVSNPTIVKKYFKVDLTQVPGSNGQAYYLNDSGTFIRGWISPVDVPNSITNMPSSGYQALLYNSSGGQISPTTGVWTIDYYAGMVMFQKGSTPNDLGWGVPKATAYVYVGTKGVGQSNKGEKIASGVVNFDSSSPLQVIPVNTGSIRISRIYIDVATAFNGTAPALSIGSAIVPDDLVNNLNLLNQDKYVIEVNSTYVSDLILTYNADSSTVGQANITVDYFVN